MVGNCHRHHQGGCVGMGDGDENLGHAKHRQHLVNSGDNSSDEVHTEQA